MRIIAKHPMLYNGVLYAAGDVFDCLDDAQIARWAANGAVGLMGAEPAKAAQEGAQAVTESAQTVTESARAVTESAQAVTESAQAVTERAGKPVKRAKGS